MIGEDDIKKLASLARVGLSAEEIKKLEHDVSSILGYVDQIKQAEVTMDSEGRVGSVKNVLRDDVVYHTGGEYTEKLLNEAPHRDGQYISVKKILGSSDNEN